MKNSPSRPKLFGITISVLIITLDLLTKTIVMIATMPGARTIEISSFLNIVLVFNRGISFGMLSNTDNELVTTMLPFVLSLIVIGMLIWLARTNEKLVINALGFIIGGALGNLIDRARSGFVVDFIDFHIGDYHWPAFNVADSSIFIGVVILFFANILGERSLEKEVSHENK